MNKALAKKNPLTKQTARALIKAFTKATQSGRRAAINTAEALLERTACGLMLAEVQDAVEWGDWLPWMDENCNIIPTRTAYRWISKAKGACQLAGIDWKARPNGKPIYLLLTSPEKDLTARERKMRTAIFETVSKPAKAIAGEFEEQKQLTDGKPKAKAGKRNRKAEAEEKVRMWLTRTEDLIGGGLLALVNDDLRHDVLALKAELVTHTKGMK